MVVIDSGTLRRRNGPGRWTTDVLPRRAGINAPAWRRTSASGLEQALLGESQVAVEQHVERNAHGKKGESRSEPTWGAFGAVATEPEDTRECQVE
jgi:hypothetical protein